MIKKKAFFIAVLVGVGVFCIGFITMLLFWMNYNGEKNIPGFFDYRAATWGDGLCLPLLVASLAYYFLRFPRKVRSFKALIGGAVAMIIGAAVQVSWLLDKSIKPNWTIPYAGHFTAAGWYHAVYFVVMFGLVAFFMIGFFQNRYNELKKLGAMGDDKISESFAPLDRFNELLIIETLVAFVGSLYCILHFVDDYSDRYSAESISTFVSLLVCASFGFLLLVTRKIRWFGTIGFFKELFMVFAGGIAACETSYLIIGIPHKSVFLGVICGLFALGFLFLYYGVGEVFVNLLGVTLVVPCLFFIAHSSGLGIVARVFFIILFFLWPGLFMLTFKERIEEEKIQGDPYLKQMICSCEIFQVAVFLLSLFETSSLGISSNLVSCFFNMGLLWVILYFIMITFRMIRNCEEVEYYGVSGNQKSIEKAAIIKMITYVSIVSVAIAGICLEIRVIRGATSNTSQNQLFYAGIEKYWMLIPAFVLLIIAGVIVKIVVKGKHNPEKKSLQCDRCVRLKEYRKECRSGSPVFYIFEIISFGLILWFVQATFGNSSAFVFDDNILWIYVFGSLICQMIGNSLFICESFYSNTYLIRGYLCGTGKVNIAYKGTVIIMGLGSMLSLAVIWGSIMMNKEEIGPDIIQLVIAVFISVLLLVGMPVLLAYFQIRKLPDRSLEFVNGNPIAEIAKDCTLGFIVFLLAGILPTYITRYSGSMAMAERTAILITYAFSFLLELVVMLEFCERNNQRHYKTLHDAMLRFMNDADVSDIVKKQYAEQLNNLKWHLKWQIKIAIVATWLYYPPIKFAIWIKDKVRDVAGNASDKNPLD